MVVDTSAILAVIFDEPHAAWVARQLTRATTELRMSTVNLSETLIRTLDRQPHDFAAIEACLLSGVIRLVPPTVEQARLAAHARLHFPLNLGDCFAYALARVEDAPLLTLDTDFRSTDLTVVSPE